MAATGGSFVRGGQSWYVRYDCKCLAALAPTDPVKLAHPSIVHRYRAHGSLVVVTLRAF